MYIWYKLFFLQYIHKKNSQIVILSFMNTGCQRTTFTFRGPIYNILFVYDLETEKLNIEDDEH